MHKKTRRTTTKKRQKMTHLSESDKNGNPAPKLSLLSLEYATLAHMYNYVYIVFMFFGMVISNVCTKRENFNVINSTHCACIKRNQIAIFKKMIPNSVTYDINTEKIKPF